MTPPHDSKTIKNRLQSVIYDSQFVTSISKSLHLPLVANERCGTWYIPPCIVSEKVYFKSTDGHKNEWSFSLRRLNLHLVDIIKANDGVIIVDSTRGKVMSDASLKTIPIWCAVLNWIAFSGGGGDDDINTSVNRKSNFLGLPSIISTTERQQIEAKIPEFAAEIMRLNLITKADIKLEKPLLVHWVTPQEPNIKRSSSAYNVVCLTASEVNDGVNDKAKRVNVENKTDPTTFHYVQGAGDDHELWAKQYGLSPELWWNEVYPQMCDQGFIPQLLTEDDIISQIQSIKSKKTTQINGIVSHTIPKTNISLGRINGDIPYTALPNCESVVILSPFKVLKVPENPKISIFHYPLHCNKKGSRELRHILPQLIPQLAPTNTLVVCDTGSDLSVAVVVILLCLNYNVDLDHCKDNSVSKDLIRQFLNKINHISRINPSRNTLQAINSYLMGREKEKEKEKE